MIYLIPSPIGNLADMTLRAIDILKKCDYILCEDTRHSKILLGHYNIDKPLFSYHKFNEKEKEELVLNDLQQGKHVGFLSDAGSPGIADPGQKLIELASKENIPYTVLPGPCAIIAALSLTGWEIPSFQWLGFLPTTENGRKKVLISAFEYSGITVVYETPHRILKTLEQIDDLAPTCKLCLVREISKTYEEVVHGTASEIREKFAFRIPKGEMVLLFAPSEKTIDFSHMSLEEHVQYLQEAFKMPLKDAIKTAASQRNLPKREIYKQIHQKMKNKLFSNEPEIA